MRCRRRSLTALAILAALVAKVGAAPLTPATAQGQVGGPPVRLRLGLSGDGVLFLPLYLAQDQQLFRREGLEVDMTVFGGGTRVAAALAAGSVDVITTSLESVVAAIAAGHPVRVFYSPSGATGFKWFARPEVAGWADLRGRRVAVSSFGSVTDVLTRYALRRHGLVAGRDVQVVQSGGPGERLAALRASRIDAAILSPPHTYAAEAHGLRYLGRQETEVGEPWPQGLLTARVRSLADQPEAIRAFLRAYVAGVRLARADRALAVRTLAERLKYPTAEAERAYAEVTPQLDERGRLPSRTLPLFWQVLVETGEVTEPWPEDRLLDRRFIDTFEQWAPR